MKRETVVAGLVILIAAAAFCAHAQGPTARSPADPQALARERWQRSGRVTPGTADLRRRALEQKLQARSLRSQFASSVSAGGSCIPLGPLPLPSDASGIGIQDYGWVSGRITAVAVDPNDLTGNTVFVGGAYGGVWKSSNAGALSPNPASVNWSPLTDDQATLAIGAIAVQPQTNSPDPMNSVVLVGTGETNSSVDSYYGLGIMRSSDGGAHWTLISQDASGTHSFAGLGFSQIVFSNTNPNLVVAAAASASQGIIEGLEIPLNANRRLYYSTDAGLNWHASTISDGSVTVGSASVTSVAFNTATGKFYAAVRFHGFYASSDGASWTRLSSQPGTGLSAGMCPSLSVQPGACTIYRGQIAVVPNRAGPFALGEMYVWYVDSNSVDQGIWQSLNGGISWMQINDSGISNCGDFFGGCGTAQGTYNLALAAVPNGMVTDLYAGASNLYKCTITAASPACSGTGTNNFLNLTHAYGCSDIAKVHPEQHAMDFLVANGAALMYFASLVLGCRPWHRAVLILRKSFRQRQFRYHCQRNDHSIYPGQSNADSQSAASGNPTDSFHCEQEAKALAGAVVRGSCADAGLLWRGTTRWRSKRRRRWQPRNQDWRLHDHVHGDMRSGNTQHACHAYRHTLVAWCAIQESFGKQL